LNFYLIIRVKFMGNDNIFRCSRNSEAGTAQLVDQKRTQVSLENEMRLRGICILLI
jgi:hypothetical protein